MRIHGAVVLLAVVCMAVEALAGSLSEHRRIVKRDKEVHQAQKPGGNGKKSDPSKSKQGGSSHDGNNSGNNGGGHGGSHGGSHSSGSSNSDSNDWDNAPAPGPSVGLTPPPPTPPPAPAPAPVAADQPCPSGSAVGSYAGCTDRMTILTCSDDSGTRLLVAAPCTGATCCTTNTNPPTCAMTNNPSTVCYGSG